MHVVAVPDATVVGTHASADTDGFGATVMVAVALLPKVAVTVTVWDVATEPPVVVNVVAVALAGTVTDGGTGNAAALLEASATTLPPAGAC